MGRILVDMDGIVVDTQKALLDIYNRECDDCLTAIDIKDWHIPRAAKDPAKAAHMESIFQRIGFFDNLEPMPGAVDAILNLIAFGHEVCFVTAPCGPDSARGKIEWVRRVFGPHGITDKDIILTHHKDWLSGDVIIDDKPSTIQAFSHKPGFKVVTIGYPYNESVAQDCDLYAESYFEPFKAWQQIVSYITKHVPVGP